MTEFPLDLVPATESAAQPYKRIRSNADVPRADILDMVVHRVILNGNNTAYTKALKNRTHICLPRFS